MKLKLLIAAMIMTFILTSCSTGNKLDSKKINSIIENEVKATTVDKYSKFTNKYSKYFDEMLQTQLMYKYKNKPIVSDEKYEKVFSIVKDNKAIAMYESLETNKYKLVELEYKDNTIKRYITNTLYGVY